MNEYSIHGGRKGNERLAILSRTVGATTSKFLDAHQATLSGSCLDLGCGSGSVSLDIAKRLQGRGEVYGLDMDPVNIASAQEAASRQQVQNIQFQRFDAYELTDTGRYNAVYSRFLLSHLHDPAKVLDNIFRGLVPGGRVLLEDTDFSGHFCYPASPAFDAYVRLYQALLEARGADANIGRKLHQLLQQAGFQEISVQVVQPVHTQEEGKLMAEITMEGIAGALLQEGLAGEAEIRETVRELKAFRADELTIMSLPRIFQVSAVKSKN
ncbi:MAG: methyltransferase domain-containing protein [Phaeodactylibacter sp.]|nr:methyltransferase domain-containing protein [Phaeodactylibacter sp.]